MPHLESKTKLIMTASVNRYINPKIIVYYPRLLAHMIPYLVA